MTRVALTLAMALGVVGCFAHGDESLMAIELYWEEDADGDPRAPLGTCRSARVYEMEWALYDENDELVDGRTEECADAIDVIDPLPGVYRLEITGFDRDEQPLWRVSCGNLRSARFDVTYICDIPRESE